MPRRPYKIKKDGKDYTFMPGENGSLTAPAPQKDQDLLMGEGAKNSKVVPMTAKEAFDDAVQQMKMKSKPSPASPTVDQMVLRAKRRSIASTLAGSRG